MNGRPPHEPSQAPDGQPDGQPGFNACALGIGAERLAAWWDGLLTPPERQRLDGHVAACRACQAQLAGLDRMDHTLRSRRAPDLQAQVWRGLQRRMENGNRRTMRMNSQAMRGALIAATAAALVVALFAGILLTQGHRNSSPGTGIGQTPTPGPTATATPSPTPSPTPTQGPSTVTDNWHIVASPDTSAEVGVLKGIAAASPGDLWAVGNVNTQTSTSPLIEHGNGSAWTIVAGPTVNGGTFNDLNAVAVVSPSDVWAVGTSGTKTLAEHWNGSQWSRVASPNQGSMGSVLFGVAAIASNNVWAAGYYVTGAGCGLQTEPLIEHWNGAQWSIAPSPHVTSADPSIELNAIELNAISATSASDVWAVGTVGGDGLIEHYNGVTWSQTPAPSGTDLLGVSGLSTGNAWAVGLSQNGPVTAHWNGSQWMVHASPQTGPGQDMLVGIAGVSPNDLWAVGGNVLMGCNGSSQPLIEHWNGQAWSIVTSSDLASLSYGYLDAVVAISANGVWAVGQTYGGASGQHSLIVHYTG